MTVEELRPYLKEHWQVLTDHLAAAWVSSELGAILL